MFIKTPLGFNKNSHRRLLYLKLIRFFCFEYKSPWANYLSYTFRHSLRILISNFVLNIGFYILNTFQDFSFIVFQKNCSPVFWYQPYRQNIIVSCASICRKSN